MSFFLRGCIVASLSATLFAIPALAQNSVGIGTTTPNASSALDIVSTAGGVLLPRLTQVQRLAIATPAKGLLVFQTDGTSPGFWYNAGTALAPFWTPFLIANDNLGNHTATTDLNLNGNRLSGGGSGNVGLPGSTTLELGNGVAGKNAFAGKIGYQTFSDGLDIVGAGTGFTDRKIKLWAEGGLTINTLAGTGTRVVTADALGNLASVATSTLGADNLGNHTATTALTLGDNPLRLRNDAFHQLRYDATVNGAQLFGNQGGQLGFNQGTYTPVLNWNSSSNVGIGTTAPTARLDVDGSTRLRGLTVAGVVTTDASGNLTSVAANTLGNDNLGNHTATTTLNLNGNALSGGGSGNVGLPGSTTLELGNGVAGKNQSAGKIGYQTFTADALDIVGAGAGPTGTNRKIKLWAEGGLTINTLAGTGTRVVTADALGNLASVATNTLGPDNLGNHTATTTLNLNGNALSGGGSNNVGIVSGTTLELGSGVAGKDVFAGKIGYQAFTADALDIVGAGTNGANRKIKLWAEGGLTINTLAGTGTRVVTADASGNLASVASSSLTDNLGNHTATTALNMQGNILTGSGASVSGVGVGVRADGGLNLGQNTVGNNVNLGYNAGFGLTTGADNTFVGFQSGRDATGSANAFLGRDTGYNTTGSNNTFAGYQAGVTNTTGANNTALGHQAGPSGAGLSNTTAIGYQAQAGQSNALVLGGTGLNAVSVGIGTATPTATLDVVGGTRLRGLTTAGIVTTNASGVLSSVAASTLGDNLGNHTATQTLVLNDNVLRLRNDAFHQLRYDGGPDGPQLFGFGGGQLGFNQGTYTPVLSWNTSSNVGIGTTAPTARLDVAGTIRLRTLTTAGIVTTDANGNLTSVAASSLADNLGNHTATTTLNLNGNALSGGSSNNVGIVSGTTLELGNGVAGKDANAGKIGYNAFGSGALDIVGAGTTGSNRKVKIWAEGGTLINSLAGTGTRMVTTDASGNLGSAAITSGAADNLGNHTATTTLNMQGNALIGTGASIGSTVGVGVRADGGLNLGQNTTGNSIYLGYQAGQSNTGLDNLFIGYQSGQANTSGFSNLFLGKSSGQANTTGQANVFVGFRSGQANTSGSDNLFMGLNSGVVNTTGGNNMFLGTASGSLNTTGGSNLFLGTYSGARNSIGSDNLFLGSNSGNLNTSGSRNLFMGTYSGSVNTTGIDNLCLGYNSGQSNTTGGDNLFLGTSSGFNNITGGSNTFLGTYSGGLNTTGSNNLFLGYQAGSTNATGSNNVAVGFQAGPGTLNSALTNTVALGYNAQVTQSNSLVLGGTGANALKVGIGLTAPVYTLDVVGTVNASGQVRAGGVVLTSDARLKTRVRPLGQALAGVLALRGVRYEWNALGVARGGVAGQPQIGLLAQELEQVYPELVSTGPDGYKAVNYPQLVPVLIEALKEQQARIEALQAQNAGLRQDVTASTEALEARLQRLESGAAATSGQARR